jgi:hypothetical protein
LLDFRWLPHDASVVQLHAAVLRGGARAVPTIIRCADAVVADEEP